MSDTYTKLFSSITESTVWSEPHSTRTVWVTLLAMADASGEVHASVPGLARRANATREETEAALASFLAPDPDSRTTAFEGRRIEAMDGGWRLLNHAKYAAIRNEAERAEYKRQWDRDNRPSGHTRAKQSDNSPTTGQQSDDIGSKSDSPTPPALTPTLEEQEQKRQQRDGRRGARLPDGWEPSQAVREWAASEFPAVSLQTTLAEFADYWRSLPGQRGCKLDWDATFRNRVREVAARQFRGMSRAPPASQSKSKTMQSINVLEEMKNAAVQQETRRTLVSVGDTERPPAIAHVVA